MKFKFESKINKKEEKSDKFKKVKGLRKFIIPAVVTVASVFPMKDINTKPSTIDSKTNKIENTNLKQFNSRDTILPEKTWRFVEDTDSIWAQNDSEKYPGFVENYLKLENEERYFFNGYEDKDGGVINTPDEIKKQINAEKDILNKYSNPEKWAFGQFEYQKTKEFEIEEFKKYILKMEERIKDLKDKIEMLKETNYPKEDLDFDKKNLEKYKKSLEFVKGKPESIIKKRSLEELKKEAEGFVFLADKHIETLQEELDTVLVYIESNKK